MNPIHIPFYGSVRAITKHGNTFLLATNHPEDGVAPIFSVNIAGLLRSPAPLSGDQVSTISVPHSVLGFVKQAGKTLAVTSAGLYEVGDSVSVFCSGENIQGACALDDQNLVLVGKHDVSIFDGSTVTKIYQAEQEITAWASQKGGKRFSLGLSDGSLVPFFEKEGAFVEGSFLDEDDEQVARVHGSEVSLLLYVETDTPRGTEEALISVDIDNQVFHTSILEGKSLPRNAHNHTKQILGIIDCDFDAKAAGLEREPYFYTVGMGGIIQPCARGFKQSKIKKEPFKGALSCGVMTRLTMSVDGVEQIDHPTLIVGGENALSVYPIVNHTTASLMKAGEPIKLLGKNGQLLRQEGFFLGGDDFITSVQKGSSGQQCEGIQLLGGWSLAQSVRQVASFLRNTESSQVRTVAYNALINFQHPRQIVEMRSLVRYHRSNKIKEDLYVELKKRDRSLHPYRQALYAHVELAKEAVRDLAERYRKDKEQAVFELLVDQLGARESNAKEAYAQFLGDNAVVKGAEGILYGLRSRYQSIHQDTLRQLSLRKMLKGESVKLALRDLLESDSEDVRERALLIALLRVPDLAYLLRSTDRGIHNQLCDLEYADREEAEAAKKKPLDKKRVDAFKKRYNAGEESEAEELIFELSACFQTDVSIIPTVINAMFQDPASMTILESLVSKWNYSVARWAAVGLSQFALKEETAYDALRSRAHSTNGGSSSTLTRMTALDGFLAAAKAKADVKGFEYMLSSRGEDTCLSTLAELNDWIAELAQGQSPEPKEEEEEVEHTGGLTSEQQERLAILDTLLGLNPDDTIQPLRDKLGEGRFLNADELKEIRHNLYKNRMRNEADTFDDVLSSDAAGGASDVIKVDFVGRFSGGMNQTKMKAAARKAGYAIASDIDDATHVIKGTKASAKDLKKLDTFSGKILTQGEWNTMLKGAGGGAPAKAKPQKGSKAALLESFRSVLNVGLSHSNVKIAREAFLIVLNNRLYDFGEKVPESTLKYLVKHPDNRGHLKNWIIDELGIHLSDGAFWAVKVITSTFRTAKGVAIFDAMLPKLPANARIRKEFFTRAINANNTVLASRALRAMFTYTGDWMGALFQKALNSKEEKLSSTAISEKALEALKKEGLAGEQILKALESGKEALVKAALSLLRKDPELFSKEIQAHLFELLEAKELSIGFFLRRGPLGWTSRSGTEESYFSKLYQLAELDEKRRVIESLPTSGAWVEAFYAEVLTHTKLEIVECGVRQQFSRKASASKTEAQAYLKRLVLSKTVVQRVAGIRTAMSNYHQYPFAASLFQEGMNAIRKDAKLKKKVAALSQDSAWRVNIALGLLEDGSDELVDIVLQVLEISALDKKFIEGLKTHENPRVAEWAQDKTGGSFGDGDLAKLLKTPPPTPPERPKAPSSRASARTRKAHAAALESYQDELRLYRMEKNIWREDIKKGLALASKNHITDVYDEIKSLANKLTGGGIDKQWGGCHALRVPAILAMGFTCPKSKFKDLETLFDEELERLWPDGNSVSWSLKYQNKVAAAKALSYTGSSTALKWLKSKRYQWRWNSDSYSYEQYYKYISDKDMFLATIALGESSPETVADEMNSNSSTASDVIFATGLRLGRGGGRIDPILTRAALSNNAKTALMANRLIGTSDNREALLETTIDFLNDTDLPLDDPFAVSQKPGSPWYGLTSSLLFKAYSLEVNTKENPDYKTWEDLGSLFASSDTRICVRAASALYDYRHGDASLIQLSSQVKQYTELNGSVKAGALKLGRKSIDAGIAGGRAFGAYTRMVRDFYGAKAREALYHMVHSSPSGSERRLFSVLRTYLHVDSDSIQTDAFGYIAALQEDTLSELPLSRLINFGVQSQNDTLKKMALVLVWNKLDDAEKYRVLEGYIRGEDDATASLAFEMMVYNYPDGNTDAYQQKLEDILAFGMQSNNRSLRSLASDKAIKEYLSRKNNGLGNEDRILKILDGVLSGEHAAVANDVAAKMAKARIVESHTRLIELYRSDDRNEQHIGIQGLLDLSLPVYDEKSESWTEHLHVLKPFGYTRTSLLLLDRADKDRGGAVDRSRIFSAVNQLKDRHTDVVDRLFSLVEQGTADPDYNYAIQSLLVLSGFSSGYRNILGINWETRTDEQRKTEEEHGFDETIYARLLDMLHRLGHYQTVMSNNLFGRVYRTRTGAVDKPLAKFASLKPNKELEPFVASAVNTLVQRLDGFDDYRSSDSNKEEACLILAGLLGKKSKKGPLLPNQIAVAGALGRAAYNENPKVMRFLRTVAESSEYDFYDRKRSIYALGELANIGAVSALLNLVGFDPDVKPLDETPLQDMNWSSRRTLEQAAFEALGHMAASPQHEEIFNLLLSKVKDSQYTTACYKGLPYFGARKKEYAEALRKIFEHRFVRVHSTAHRSEVLTAMFALTDAVEAEQAKPEDEYPNIGPDYQLREKLRVFFSTSDANGQSPLDRFEQEHLLAQTYHFFSSSDTDFALRKEVLIASDRIGPIEHQKELIDALIDGLSDADLLAFYFENRVHFKPATINRLEEVLSSASLSAILDEYDVALKRLLKKASL
ncbi:MAG: hypothetical protein VX278_16625, partial [Myxococcota bacterium]|nr:hypothetical protein [Myxococcota bacterium]